jgi:uncharacterized membrane protein (UPF0127 family)
MIQKLIGFNYKNKKINVEVKIVPWWFKGIGLMFSKKQKAKALLFSFNKPVKIPIHSWFVFYDFFAIWLDENKKIIEIKKIKPFSFKILPSRKFKKLIEIPINDQYDKILNLIDGEETFK